MVAGWERSLDRLKRGRLDGIELDGELSPTGVSDKTDLADR